MIEITDWTARRPGDVFFHRDPGDLLSQAIVIFEKRLHPGYTGSFFPSHTGAIGFGDTVIEAWMNFKEDSAAATDPASKYDGAMAAGDLKLFRFGTGNDNKIEYALKMFLADYRNLRYAWINLLGFAIEGIRGGNNPINAGNVCSQSMRDYSRYVDLALFPDNSQTDWLSSVPVRNTDPLGLYIAMGGS
jgi:hypothetical protein